MTLSADLAARTDDELVELFAARPDLLQRPPSSFGDLAGRLAAGRAAEAIVEGLDAWKLQVLEAIVFLEPAATVDGAAELLGRGHAEAGGVDLRGAVEAAARRLRAVGLVWSGSGAHASALHALDPVRRMFPRPFGLGPSARSAFNSRPRDELIVVARTLGLLTATSQTATKAVLIERVAAALADPALVGEVLADAPEASRKLFDDALATGWASIPYTYGGGRSRGFGHLDWLISHGLLIPASYDRAVVPREVAVSVRGRVVDSLAVVRPASAVPTSAGSGPDPGTAAAARSIVAAVDGLCLLWGDVPAAVLRSTGGVGAREVKRAAKALDVPEEDAAFVMELADAAHLVAFDAKADGVLPTATFDEWRRLPVVGRWMRLVEGWQQAGRQLSLSGRKGIDDKYVPALLPVAGSRWAAWQRETVLRALHERGGPVAAADVADLAAAVTWVAPARWTDPFPAEEMAARVIGEAIRLGVAGADPDDLESWASAALGGPPAGLTLQADLTAMAAGAVDPELAQLLDVGAEVVSAGTATVWRFSAPSIRDALDAGWTSDAILELLEKHATKGVPQPLAYLIADVARTHGTIRVGAVGCYLRSDEPAVLADVARMKGAAKLGLRIVAPTIAVAKAKPAEVLAALRAAGHAPAEEDATGAIVVRSRSPHRATTHAHRSAVRHLPEAAPALRPVVDPLEVIRTLRKGPKPVGRDSEFDLDTEMPTSLEHAMAMIDARFSGDLRPGRAFFDDDDDFEDDDFDDEDDDDDDLGAVADLVSDAKLLTILYESIRTGAAVMIEWQKTPTRMQRQLVRVVSVANDGEVLVVGVSGGAPFPIALGQIEYAALTRTR